MNYTVRLTEKQHTTLKAHLFPADGGEAVALLLCGRRDGSERHAFTVNKIRTIPYDLCNRKSDRIMWPTSFIDDLLAESFGTGQAIVKVHSHPSGYRDFSSLDDHSDRELFASVMSLLNDGLPQASIIMLPNGEMFGRAIENDGETFLPIRSIMSVGDDLRIWEQDQFSPLPSFMQRHAQAFGSGTFNALRNLSIAVVGCSGTGSIVAEQLARLGVGRIVLVDPETIEEKNLNRILNSGKKEAYLHRPKVEVLAEAIARMGFGQEVLPIQSNLINTEAVKAVAECDVVFGCMDGAEGRHMLNRIATFYTIPYFDVGVRVDADGKGGIDVLAGAVHYLQPGKSTLLSREVYSMARVEAEELYRTNPEMYQQQIKEGYLRRVHEDRPAIISVNMLFASLAVNDFLARLHPYRNHSNGEYSCIGLNLCEMQVLHDSDQDSPGPLHRFVGRGDVIPLLDRPALS